MPEPRFLDDGTFDAVIFDKDGTLLDFQKTWGGVVERVVRALAPSVDDGKRIADELGFSLDTYAFAPDSVLIAESNAVIADRISRIAPAVDLAALERQVSIAAEGATAARDGAAELLAALATSRIPVAVATNDSAETARSQLRELGWLDQFVAVVGYDSGHGAKPDGAMVAAALDVTGALPHRAAMVGDSSHDLDAGRAAGLVTVYVGPDPAVAETADIAVEHLASLSQYSNGVAS